MDYGAFSHISPRYVTNEFWKLQLRKLNGLRIDILEMTFDSKLASLDHILRHRVKPLFSKNPHPSLNLSTGRKMASPAGGFMASQDYYEGQAWKNEPGSSYLVSWCVRNTKVCYIAFNSLSWAEVILLRRIGTKVFGI